MDLVLGFIGLVAIAMFVVMLVRRPSEIAKEKFEKRDW